MAQTHTLAVALGATYAGLTLRIQMADVLTGAAVNFASVGSSSGSAAWRTDADSDTQIVQGVAGTYTVRCTAWPDAGSLPVRVDIYNATGPVLLASGLLAQADIDAGASAIADAIADEALAGHTTAGTAGKAWADAAASGNPWDTDPDADPPPDGSYGDILQGLAGGTVYATGSTPNTTAALYIRRGDTVAVTIGDLTGLAAGWDVLWVTIKKSVTDDDSEAILQVRLNTATPALPGLIYINGQTPTDAGCAATDAWISDVDAGADTLVLNIKPAASLLLPAMGSLWFDVQQLDGTTITSLATGERSAEIGGDVTRATS